MTPFPLSRELVERSKSEDPMVNLVSVYSGLKQRFKIRSKT